MRSSHTSCRLVEAGELRAEIDEAAGVVHFLEDPEDYCSPQMAAQLHAQLQQAAAISQKLAKLDFEARLPAGTMCAAAGVASWG